MGRIFLSTLSLRRATPEGPAKLPKQIEFLSTLSLRRATRTYHQYLKDCRFLSTLSLRRATADKHAQPPKQQISIHALLAESDSPPSITPTASRNFYPRSPCGERLVYALILADTMLFLSTLSLRRATREKPRQTRTDTNFYPRSPCGERLRHCTTYLNCSRFLSTLSLRRATVVYALILADTMLFLSTLSLRRATNC